MNLICKIAGHAQDPFAMVAANSMSEGQTCSVICTRCGSVLRAIKRTERGFAAA